MPTATETGASTLQPLVIAQGATRDSIAAQITALASASVRSFSGWYDTDQIAAWSANLSKTIEPLLRLLARNTDAYLARSVAGVSGSSFRPVGAIDVANLRRGLSHAGAYARAADVYRFQQYIFDQTARAIQARVTLVDGHPVIGEGTDLDGIDLGPLNPPDLIDPLDAAERRAADVADQDTSLTVQQQSQTTLQAAEKRGLITGWRRVLHPELSEGGSCGLCVAASDRVYKVSDLMPIHQRCKCVPAAVRDGNDPGSILNEEDLKRLYADAGSTGRADLKRTRYRIDEHGNLGPLLVDASSKRRSDPGSDRSKPRTPQTPEQRQTNAQKVHDQLAATLPKAKALADDDPKKWGPYYQKLEARVADLARQLA